MNTTKFTTTNIGVEELKHLRKLSTHHRLKQVEFINSAIEYFKKTGINPAEEIYSPREEIARLTKRTDEVVRFIQVFEKQKLSPLLEHLIILEKKLSENYANAITSSELNDIAVLMERYKSSLGSSIDSVKSIISSGNKSISEQISLINENQRLLIILLETLFEDLNDRKIIGSRKDQYTNKFNDALSKIR
ncbi:MAG TPA: BfmA/BtgA family mobilization protein [Tenuifilaceae bacterium]|nr:BfmA/BtgA family mobilization protein [Tenuifilaceae bacterium]